MYFIECLFSFHLVFFLEFCPVLSSGTCFFVSSFFFLTRSISFYAVHKCAMYPRLDRVTLCRRFPVEPSGTVFCFTWAGCSRRVCCLCCVCHLIAVVPQFLLTSQWLVLTFKLIGCEGLPWLELMSYCSWADPTKWESLYLGSGSSWGCPSGVSIVEVWSVGLLCALKPSSKCFKSGTSWEGLQCRPSQTLLMLDLGSLVGAATLWSSCIWLPLVLGLEVIGRVYSVNQPILYLCWICGHSVGATF